ncbi:hypothetical protein AQUCO_02200133v1 [Aquilegia coerulea]|uniref:Uncharacterized protein n=1 Tax=Aquilegia coerulea TaxID=218851 RepID=A0A2G5DD94_AQUCA|nr:hypothetical protein AQUCO_02200133v1 [Aquilegia coerulea]
MYTNIIICHSVRRLTDSFPIITLYIVKLLFYSSKTVSFLKFISQSNLKESMLRTFGALGIFINKELVKKVIRRRASRFIGTFIADSFTVKSK